MGTQVVQALLARPGGVNLTVLVLPRERQRPSVRRLRRWAQQGQLTLLWGDATKAEDVALAVRGAEVVFNTMACISPAADYYPDVARQVNVDAVANVLRAIHGEPEGASRIRYVHTGTVAATGNRPPGLHWGRVGDPLKPSVFDTYALTKIAGERLVLEAGLRHWAVLRMSFIMPTTFAAQQALNDAIAFHMPLDTAMENLSDRDAGFGMASVLDLPPDTDFWGRVYNMGGGPGMRCSAREFLDSNYRLLGLDPAACYDPAWYAERNFHLQFYTDSAELNGYLHHWRDTLVTYQQALADTLPVALKLVGWLARRVALIRRAVGGTVWAQNAKLARTHRNSPLFWRLSGNSKRLAAFFFPEGWVKKGVPDLLIPTPRLNHGHDETKPLHSADLQAAAAFRGGRCDLQTWSGDADEPVTWECAHGHRFAARVYTVLGAGHWCPTCQSTWNGDAQARENPFFAQVWYADHGDENNEYPADCGDDIRGADRPTRKSPSGR